MRVLVVCLGLLVALPVAAAEETLSGIELELSGMQQLLRTAVAEGRCGNGICEIWMQLYGEAAAAKALFMRDKLGKSRTEILESLKARRTDATRDACNDAEFRKLWPCR